MNQAQVLFQSAKQAYNNRDFAQTVKLCDQLLTQLGQRDDLLNLKALSLLAAGQMEAAAGAISDAIKINPKMAGIHLNAAQIFLKLSLNKQAKRHIDEAIQLAPREPTVLYQAALLSRECADYPQAQRILDRCLQVKPDFALAWHLQGSTLIDLGKFEDAQQALEKAIELEPGNARALSALIKLRGDTLEDANTVKLLKAIKGSDAPATERGTAIFSLANMYHRDGQYDQAFALFEQANALAAGVRPFNLNNWDKRVNALIEVTQASSKFAPAKGSAGSNLVFIIGMPRSGTSLCEQILSTSPDVIACGELSAMQNIEHAFARQGLNPYQLLEENHTPGKVLTKAGEVYLEALPKEHSKRAVVIDKAPMNFERVGMIQQIFPSAKFIYCQRHPLDTILSCFMQDFHAGLGFAFKLELITRVYADHVRLMNHWQSIFPDSIYTLNYEALVNNLESEVSILTEFLDLPFQAEMLKPHLQERAVGTASNVQVRKPVNSSSIGRWKNYREQLEFPIQVLKKHDILDKDQKPTGRFQEIA
jgi:tetratricopeptide (TPR) repeat protein